MGCNRHIVMLKDEQQSTALSVAQVAKAYNFPAPGPHISDQVVAVIELGGGDDLTLAAPGVKWYGVDGGFDSPVLFDPANGEVQLDEEVIAQAAPGVKIAAIFAPNSDKGFADAIMYAVNKLPKKPCAISISWGASENQWTADALALMDAAFKAAKKKGIRVYCASGDNGSSDGQEDGKDHVDFPSSHPDVIACGGTRLLLNPDGTRKSEKVWDPADGHGGTGGGKSDLFPMRAVPDVAGNADPVTGYKIKVDFLPNIVGGTSAVAPLYAALDALIQSYDQENLGDSDDMKAAFAGASHEGGFFDVVEGANGTYKAEPGFDFCTGLGVVDGTKLLHHFGLG